MVLKPCTSTDIKYQYTALQKVEGELATMRKYGVLETDPGYQKAWRVRGTLLEGLGHKVPRVTWVIQNIDVKSRLQALGLVYAMASLVLTIEELKDATIRVWLDSELGWFSEARFKPSSPPIYNAMSSEDAIAFIKGEETGEQIARCFHQDEYLGE